MSQLQTLKQQIDAFFDGSPHAVVGASQDRHKYGNKVLRAYQQTDRPVHPINPYAGDIEGLTAYADLASVPEEIHGISIITPPPVTEAIIEEAGNLGIKHVWIQPGAESAQAVERAMELGMNVISGGPCLLVVVGYHE